MFYRYSQQNNSSPNDQVPLVGGVARVEQINMIGTTNSSRFDSWTTTLRAASRSDFMQPVSLFGPGFGPPIGRPLTAVFGARVEFSRGSASLDRMRSCFLARVTIRVDTQDRRSLSS